MRASVRYALSIARVLALSGTLVLHTIIIAYLLAETTVEPLPTVQTPITVDIQLFEPPTSYASAAAPPEPMPAPPEAAILRAVVQRPTLQVPVPTLPPQPANPPVAAAPPAALPAPPEASADWSTPMEQQRREVAAAIARENAPQRRPFRGRSIDAMLPGGDNGKLPGFRPRTSDSNAQTLQRLAKILGGRLPTAAVDPDAPTDLLTEGWEAAHHGSDLAACERQYEQFESDLRRQLCGEVRPPE